MEVNKMKTDFENSIKQQYAKLGLQIDNFDLNKESRKYDGCQFEINNHKIISRSAKITPTKTGQFVTIWKRLNTNVIAPLDENDVFDFLFVNVQTQKDKGIFIIPKSVLTRQKIISTDKQEGKRAFRLYPPWDEPKSKQAMTSQQWQLKYFFKFDEVHEQLHLQTT